MKLKGQKASHRSTWKRNPYDSKSFRKGKTLLDEQRNRDGWVASIIMGLLVLHCILTLGLIYLVRQEFIPFLWYGIVLAAATVMRLVGLGSIWKRKNWGFVVYILGMVIVAILGSYVAGMWLLTLDEVLPLVVLGYLWRSRRTAMTK